MAVFGSSEAGFDNLTYLIFVVLMARSAGTDLGCRNGAAVLATWCIRYHFGGTLAAFTPRHEHYVALRGLGTPRWGEEWLG